VHTAPGKGSTFEIYLPTADGVPAPPAGESYDEVEVKQSATVLVVDDDRAVRAIIAVGLESLGHRVILATGGREACELYRRHAGEIDLVLLDLTMPEMNGEQTLSALRELNQGVRALVMTGYAEEDVREKFQAAELAGFLWKPFSRQELVTTVKAALGPFSA